MELWKASVSARAYNPDWIAQMPLGQHPVWEELTPIYGEEAALAEIPDWAIEIIERMMELPMCGYWAFPENIMQICQAIEGEHCPDVVMKCYTVSPGRKRLMAYYVFCLDAWLKSAPQDAAVAELASRESLSRNWPRILANVYTALGESSDAKRLLVQRLVHRLRWWMKSLIWFDDKRDQFLVDWYGGDIRGNAEKWGCYGNPPFGDPFFAELRLPEVRSMDERIQADVPGGKKLLERIHSTWLCAPKVFRYVEKLILEIGQLPPVGTAPDSGELLECQDTYPDFRQCAAWLSAFVGRLDKWLAGDIAVVPELGQASPVKHWLTRILRHKLLFSAEFEENFGKLVGSRPAGKAGSRSVSSHRIITCVRYGGKGGRKAATYG